MAERLTHHKDLRFLKLDTVWGSEENLERLNAFRERTGLDASTILRRPVVANGAQPKDWAALFAFVFEFGWDAAAISRKAGTLVWFSHDEFLIATPASLVRGV